MMMAQRSVLRPDQLDSNGSYEFAQLTIDGYSGGDLEDGYLTGLIFQDRANGGATRLEIHADDGEINQTGDGQVTFTGNVEMKANAIVQGDFTVNGTTTYINTEQMLVTDPITTLNVSGTESLSSWTGLSERDTDGYNRTGWVFDGYWGLSSSFTAGSDVVPDRAIAYIGAGDAYGDLSSTEIGDSGASKIGVDDSGVVVGDDVQEALENIFNSTTNLTGTPSDSWQVNNDADAATDEDACLVLSGGDGTALIDGYLCMITDSVNGDRFQFVIYEDGVKQNPVVHVGDEGNTDDLDACVVLNSGDGSNAYQASLCLDGDGKLTLSSEDILLDGDIFLGTGSEDCINFDGVVCSDILPCCDDAYDIGSETQRWQDGYFVNLDSTTVNTTTINTTIINTTDLNVTNDIDINGTTTFDGCVVFNGGICSDIIPCCDDAYDIGDSTHRFNDGYFTNLDAVTIDVTTVNATTVNATDVNTTNVTTTGDVSIGDDLNVTGLTTFDGCVVFNGGICSDIIPCCDDAYDIGDSTHRFNDGYFVNLTADNLIFTDTTIENLEITGCLTVAEVCSDLTPCCDDSYQMGDTTHRWIDAYYVMPIFDNITPVGDVNSLIGVLEGIDDALSAVTLNPERAVYEVTLAESIADTLDSSRTADQGTAIDLSTYTDIQFRDNIFIYRNGQLLYNDPTSKATVGAVANDVARQTGTLNNLLFSGNLRKNAIVQIVDMT